MFLAECHCGNVRLVTKEIPKTLTSCNCSICNRVGALWAYYKATDVEISIRDVAASIYLWDKKEIELHHCPQCGCTTHYSSNTEKEKQTVINTRMAKLKLIKKIPVKKFDGVDTWEFVNS